MGGAVAGTVALGVVSAPVASGALLVVGAVSGGAIIYKGIVQASNGNWAGVAFSADVSLPRSTLVANGDERNWRRFLVYPSRIAHPPYF